MTTTATAAIFAIVISLGGTETTSVGPFPDMGSCVQTQKTIRADISRGFSTDGQYGMTGDMWNAGGGAIFRASDYKVECERQVRDTTTGEIVSTMRFN